MKRESSIGTGDIPAHPDSVWVRPQDGLDAAAAMLAAGTGRNLVPVDDLDRRAGARGIICAPYNGLSDAALGRLLDETADALRGGTAWEEIARIGLLTARDGDGISNMAAKMLAPGAGRGRLLLLDSGRETATLYEAAGAAQFATRELAPDELVSLHARSAGVLALHTHGSEACAKGLGGFVYCGKSADAAAPAAGTGHLACGQGHACPRGPLPRSIAPMADVLFMGVCGGLRLADSINLPDYNFALAFADGPGRAYVSSVTSSSGSMQAALAFMATIFDGGNVGDATLAANAIVLLAGLDDPSFLLVGDPELVPAGPPRSGVPLPCEALPEEADGGADRSLVLIVDDPRFAAAAAAGDLVLRARRIDGGADQEVVGFARSLAAPGRPDRLEVRLFSFPAPLGRLALEAHSLTGILASCREVLAALERWASLWAATGVAQLAPDEAEDLAAARAALADGLAASTPLLRVCGSFPDFVLARLDFGRSLLASIAEQSVALLAPSLETSFWLSNALAPRYRFEGSVPAPCPTCAGPARVRRLRDDVLGAGREVLVCGRCGIGLDRAGGSALAGAAIALDGPARGGHDLVATLVLASTAEQVAHLALRLTMPGQECPTPEPAFRTVLLRPGENRVSFACALPPATAPHRYYLKLLVGTEGDLAFACRPFFVLPAAR